MKRFAQFAAIVATAFGCQSYNFIFQSSGTLSATTTDVTIDVPSESDVLFVLDNSGSMAPKIDKLKAQVTEFVQALSATGNQFRVGITTIDQQDPDPSGNCTTPWNPTPGADTLYNGVCGHLLAPEGKAPFLDRANYTGADAATQMAADITGYMANINPNGSSWEQPLKGAWNALDPNNTQPGGPDAGFFRPGALLVVLILTDESDCSYEPGDGHYFIDGTQNGADGDYCYTMLDHLVAPEEWGQRIVDRHGGDPRLVAVGVISGAYNDANQNLLEGPCAEQVAPTPATDPISPICYGFDQDPFFNTITTNGAPGDTVCDAVANSRLFDFSGQFSNLRDSICRVDYSQALLRLADLADRQCFSLQAAPINDDPSNIQIQLRRKGSDVFNPVPQDPNNGWSYDSDPSPEVCLHGTDKRQEGDTVRLFVLDTQSGDTSQPASR